MNRKKIILFLSTIIICAIFIIPTGVKANECDNSEYACAVCEYETAKYKEKLKYIIKSDGKSIDVFRNIDTFTVVNGLKTALTDGLGNLSEIKYNISNDSTLAGKFINGNKLKCYDNLYISGTALGLNINIEKPEDLGVGVINLETYVTTSLTSSSYNNNLEIYKSQSNNNNNEGNNGEETTTKTQNCSYPVYSYYHTAGDYGNAALEIVKVGNSSAKINSISFTNSAFSLDGEPSKYNGYVKNTKTDSNGNIVCPAQNLFYIVCNEEAKCSLTSEKPTEKKFSTSPYDKSLCDGAAWGCAVCKYTNDKFKDELVYFVKSDGENLTIQHSTGLKSDVRIYQVYNRVEKEKFAYSSPQLPSCPTTLYGAKSEQSGGTTGQVFLYVYSEDKGEYTFSLIDGWDNKKSFFSDPTKNAEGSFEKTCKGVLGEDFSQFLKKIFDWVRIIAPIIVIVLTSIDFAGALLKDDKDALSKASGKLVKRLIVAIALFLVPTILNILIDIYNSIVSTKIDMNCL